MNPTSRKSKTSSSGEMRWVTSSISSRIGFALWWSISPDRQAVIVSSEI
jgi:hypothetical protein